MRWLALGLAILFFAACASEPMKPVENNPQSRLPKKLPTRQKSSPPPGKTPLAPKEAPQPQVIQKQSRPPTPSASTPEFKSGIEGKMGSLSFLPAIIHPIDHSSMVRVPKGTYWVSDPAPYPIGPAISANFITINLPAFYIDRNEITVKQFQKFAKDYDEKIYTGGKACPGCPAMAIDWIGANRYCLWAGKRLPSESEWEAAARGAGQKKLPWGKRLLSKSANLAGNKDGNIGPTQVGSYPLGASPFGAVDLIGNVWEWVNSPPDKDQSNTKADPAPLKGLVKGGSHRTPISMAHISLRNPVDGHMKNPAIGFRCVKSGG